MKVWKKMESNGNMIVGVFHRTGLERKVRMINRVKKIIRTLSVVAGATIVVGTSVCAKDVSDYHDVPASAWFYSYVADVSTKGLMTGLDENTFGASQNLGRGQFATVLYRMAESPETTYEVRFPDVPDGVFYSKPVIWASNSEIVTGYDNGRFGASDNITREQMATMLFRYAKASGLSTEAKEDYSGFPDAGRVSGFASEAVQWAVGSKIISGDNGNINPQGNVSRAVCATMISRFVSANEGGNEGGGEQTPETPENPENPNNIPTVDTVDAWAAEKGWTYNGAGGSYETNINGIIYACIAGGTFDQTSLSVQGDASVSGKVEILDSVEGIPVTAIRYGGFYFNNNITEVVIPATVTKMSPNAFDNCEGITSFTFKGAVPEGFNAINVHGNPFTVNYPSGAAGWDTFQFIGAVIEANATYVAY